MLTVKANRKTRTIQLPTASNGLLARGTEFIFSVSGDTILLKQVQEPIWRTASRIPDPNPMTMEEIVDVVREVRQEMYKSKKK